MTDEDSPDDEAEAVVLYELAEEARLTIHALHDAGMTPDENPAVWADLKGALETARTRAASIPAFEYALDERVADTAEEFLEQIRQLDEATIHDAVNETAGE